MEKMAVVDGWLLITCDRYSDVVVILITQNKFPPYLELINGNLITLRPDTENPFVESRSWRSPFWRMKHFPSRNFSYFCKSSRSKFDHPEVRKVREERVSSRGISWIVVSVPFPAKHQVCDWIGDNLFKSRIVHEWRHDLSGRESRILWWQYHKVIVKKVQQWQRRGQKIVQNCVTSCMDDPYFRQILKKWLTTPKD